MRNPDLAAVGPDQNRQEWRPGATAVAPQSVQPAQSLPPGTIMQPTSPNPVAYPFDPQHYYAYKAQPIVLAPPQGQAQLSDMELMALRGAHAVLNSKPSQEGLFRLSQMLNRPHSLLIEWFRSQEAFRPADQVGDMHQSFVQSPVLTQTDQAIARHANSAPRSQADNQSTPILQDFRKTDTDISMGTAGDSPNIIQSTKLQNGREQDPNKNLHHQVDPKTMPDSSSAMRQGVAQEGSTAGAIVQQVPAGIYPTYMYSNGLDGGMMMPHQTSAFHAAPGAASAPMLAPLRYVSGSSANAQTYIPQNMWYHPAPSFPK